MTLEEGWEPVGFVRDWWSVWSGRDGCSEWDKPLVSSKGYWERKRDGRSGRDIIDESAGSGKDEWSEWDRPCLM